MTLTFLTLCFIRQQNKREIAETQNLDCPGRCQFLSIIGNQCILNSSWNPYTISIIAKEFPPDQHPRKGLPLTSSLSVATSF